jgi:hypothetical protein
MANKWLTHVKKTMKSHKGKKFGDILKMAKKTYKGGADVEGSPSMSSGPMSPAPVGGRRRKTRRGRKGGNVMKQMNGMMGKGMMGSGYGMY